MRSFGLVVGSVLGVVGFVACGSSPAVRTSGDGARTALCSHVTWPADPAWTGDWEGVAKALGPEAPEPEPCAPMEDCHEIYVARVPEGMGSHALVTAMRSGYHLYRDAFVAGAGFACEWAPETAISTVGPWAVVRHAGESYERNEQTCDELGVLTQLALVSAETGRLEAILTCSGSPDAAIGEGPNDGQWTLEQCGEDTVTFTRSDLEACATP